MKFAIVILAIAALTFSSDVEATNAVKKRGLLQLPSTYAFDAKKEYWSADLLSLNIQKNLNTSPDCDYSKETEIGILSDYTCRVQKDLSTRYIEYQNACKTYAAQIGEITDPKLKSKVLKINEQYVDGFKEIKERYGEAVIGFTKFALDPKKNVMKENARVMIGGLLFNYVTIGRIAKTIEFIRQHTIQLQISMLQLKGMLPTARVSVALGKAPSNKASPSASGSVREN